MVHDMGEEFMKEISIEDRKKILLDILCYITNICKENNLCYYLAYGTLLGAVRHGGFIPWDDDVDIWVPINEYEKLLKIMDSSDKYTVINNITDGNWTDPFGKIYDNRTIVINNDSREKQLPYDSGTTTQRGVAVDIFPLFEIKDNSYDIVRKLFHRRNIFFRNNRGVHHGLKKVLCCILDRLNHGEAYYRRKLFLYEKKNKNTNYIGCPVTEYGNRDKYRKEWFGKGISLSFEGKFFRAPENYDAILKRIYGDYMTPPPPEECSHLYHDVKAYWIE